MSERCQSIGDVVVLGVLNISSPGQGSTHIDPLSQSQGRD